MSFGKRQDDPTALRLKVVNPHSNLAFALAACGVVVFSAGAAVAAPSLLQWGRDTFAGHPVRPIDEVVEGLDREAAKTALAREAFPDRDGRAFLAGLKTAFPSDHDRLMGALADAALKGGDRDDLLVAMGPWSMDFVKKKAPSFAKAGDKGFDLALDLMDEAISFTRNEYKEACTLAGLQRISQNPDAFMKKHSGYGTPGYRFQMKAASMLVSLGTETSSTPVVSRLTQQDATALQNFAVDLIQTPEITDLMRPGAAQTAQHADLCKVADVVIKRARALPQRVKGVAWAMGVQRFAQQASNPQMLSGFGPGQFGPGQFSRNQFDPRQFDGYPQR